jgi:hypothetical protein
MVRQNFRAQSATTISGLPPSNGSASVPASFPYFQLLLPPSDFILTTSDFILTTSFAQIVNIGYNRRRKQTRASASVVLFFNAVSCSFAV